MWTSLPPVDLPPQLSLLETPLLTCPEVCFRNILNPLLLTVKANHNTVSPLIGHALPQVMEYVHLSPCSCYPQGLDVSLNRGGPGEEECRGNWIRVTG